MFRLETRKDSLEKLQKDNITNITSQSQIESYFDFSNTNWKKRHSLLLLFEIFNLTIIIAFLISCNLIDIWKITWVSVFIGILITTIILFRYKKSSYRYLSYLLVIFGMVFAIYIPFSLDIPDYIFYPNGAIIEPSNIVFAVMVGIAIVDLIFLLNYLTIEYSRERFMSPMIRKNKMRNFFKFGHDKWEDS